MVCRSHTLVKLYFAEVKEKIWLQQCGMAVETAVFRPVTDIF